MASQPTKVELLGSIYLLHFDEPFGHARHYLGFAPEGKVEERLAKHGTSKGANLLKHVKRAGISWVLAKVWHNKTRNDERSKKGNGHARRCPLCKAERKG